MIDVITERTGAGASINIASSLRVFFMAVSIASHEINAHAFGECEYIKLQLLYWLVTWC
jgi:hypothetical protein